MGKIASMEYFRVPPRWLFVKITDEDGNVGWGESSLEGHTQAVEGCLDAWFDRYTGLDAEYVPSIMEIYESLAHIFAAISRRYGNSPGEQASIAEVPST